MEDINSVRLAVRKMDTLILSLPKGSEQRNILRKDRMELLGRIQGMKNKMRTEIGIEKIFYEVAAKLLHKNEWDRITAEAEYIYQLRNKGE